MKHEAQKNIEMSAFKISWHKVRQIRIQMDQGALQLVITLNFWQIRSETVIKAEAIPLKLSYQIKDWCNFYIGYINLLNVDLFGHSLFIAFQFLIIFQSWTGSLFVVSYFKGENSLPLRNTHNFSCKCEKYSTKFNCSKKRISC